MLISVVFLLLLNRGTCVTITPERAHIRLNTNLTVMCRSLFPLLGCQFRHGNRPVIDLSHGHNTPPTDDYRYFGNGLQQGECGVVLNTQHLANDTFHFVDCRVKTARGGWLYNEMDVYVSNLNAVNIVKMPPREVVVMEGGEVSLFVQVQGRLTKCKFRIPSLGWADFSKSLKTPVGGSYKYLGRGLRAGDCGLTLFNVTSTIVGTGFVSIDTGKDDHEILFFRFINAKPPSVPKLSVSSEDGELSASCIVTGTPWANISWFIGDELVRRDEENEALDDADWKPTRRLQTLKWRLRSGDVGKTLRCVATHLALSTTLQATTIILGLPPSVKLHIEPQRVHVSKTSNLTVVCRAQEPLYGCQFRHGDRPVIDLSAGHEANSTAEYEYFGNGLQQGECGVALNTLHLANHPLHRVFCRVKTAKGGWLYRAMDVFVSDFQPINILIMPPREIVVLPGDRASLLAKADAPLKTCALMLSPNHLLDFSTNLASNASSLYRYHGDGPLSGECGVTILNASAIQNDTGLMYIGTNPFTQEVFNFTFIIAKPPSVPELSVSFDDGELSASCSVAGIPLANISWFIGDELVRYDEENEALDDASWEPSRRFQTLKWRLRSGDVGKTLSCVATHLALSEPLESAAVIIVNSGESSRLPKSTTTAAPSSPGDNRTVPQEQLVHTDGGTMNLSLVIGLVSALFVFCVLGFIIYVWFIGICCFAHPSTREVRHGQVGMSKLLETEEINECVSISTYVGTDA